MITVRELVALDGLGLELVAGERGADREIRWVASTEIADPRPFLRGGEVLLTTGLAFGDDPVGYLERLAGAGLAGLGFAVRIHLDALPAGVAERAEQLGFPLFLVPYETPFVAITEAAMTRIVNEQYAQLARAVELHDRLVELVLEEAGLDAIAEEAAVAIGGRIRVLAHDGRVLAAAGETVPEASAIVLDVGVHAPGEAVLEATLGRPFTDWDRVQLQQARTVVALELAKRRAVAETERRIAGDLVEDAVSGTGDVRQLARRLRAFGLETDEGVAVILLRPGDADAASLAALHRRTADAVTGSGLAGLVGGEVCVLVAAPDAASAEAEAARLATTARNGGPPPVGRRQPHAPHRGAARRVRRGRSTRSRRASPRATAASRRHATSARSASCSRCRTRAASSCSSAARSATWTAGCSRPWRRSSRRTAAPATPPSAWASTATRCAPACAASRRRRAAT